MITDWKNVTYVFNHLGWTMSNTNQVHIERQDGSNLTLCGISALGWGGVASPEPDNPKDGKFYGSCLRCKKTFLRLRSSCQKVNEDE